MDNTINVGVKQKAQTVFRANSATKKPGMFKVVFSLTWLTEITAFLPLMIKYQIHHYNRGR